MRLFAYFLTRSQVHKHKLAVLACIENASEIIIAQSVLLNIRFETFHTQHLAYGSVGLCL
jgi:hypothetical protein